MCVGLLLRSCAQVSTQVSRKRARVQVRKEIGDASDFLHKVLAYDPTGKRYKKAFVAAKKCVESVTPQQADKASMACGLLLKWLQLQFEVSDKAVASRKARVKETGAIEAIEDDEEEEAEVNARLKAKEEEEAAARAAAEAEAAAAADAAKAAEEAAAAGGE